MDDTRVPLASYRDTPSLWSNLTLWEMDDKGPSEPPVQPQNERTEQSPRSSSINGTTRGSLSVTFIFPARQVSKAGSALTQPEASNSKSNCELSPSQKLDEQLQSFRFECRKGEAEAPNGYADVPESKHQLHESTPAGMESSVSGTRSKAPATRQPSEMCFLDCHPNGNATISYINDNGEVKCINGLAVLAIEERCPLLAAAFETRRTGPQLHLEVLTDLTAVPFLRYLYTGSYNMICQSDSIYGDVPTSLLLHCQLYHLGMLYDLPELLQQANVNVIRQCEFGCSSPDPPIHLSAAIKYVYKHLSAHSGILDTIVNYCVACFLRHRLAENEAFKQVAFELKPFHQALCQESMNRKFENETASAIIQMPFKRDAPATYLSREDITPSRTGRVRNLANEQSTEPARARPGRALTALTTFQQDNQELVARLKISPPVPEDEDVLEASRISQLCSANRSPPRSPTPLTLSPHTSRRPPNIERRNGDGDGRNDDSAADLSSDSDYELVPGPAHVEALSSGSESDTPVSLSHTPATATTLPMRRRDTAGSAQSARSSGALDASSESSDSEWSLV